MTKVAVIGNSHVAAVKLGWDKIRDRYPEVAVTFFATAGRAGQNRSLEGRVFGFHGKDVQPDEVVFGNDGRRTIDLSQFDHVLRVAEPKKEGKLAQILADTAVDGWELDGRAHRMSQAVFEDCVDHVAKRQVVGRQWRGWTSPEITICAAPYPDERCVGHKRPRSLDPWRVLSQRPEEFLWARNLYFERYTRELARHNIAVLQQPKETIAPNGLTLKAFSDGALLMDRPGEEGEEHIHMNGDYGALIFANYLDQISAPSGETS